MIINYLMSNHSIKDQAIPFKLISNKNTHNYLRGKINYF